MNKLQKKIERVRETLVENNESFSLFALVKLKADLKRWDVVVCADWLPKRKKEAIRIVFDELKKELTSDEFALISRVVVLDEAEPFVEQVRTLSIDNKQLAIFKNQTISDLSIKEIRVLQCEAKKEIESSLDVGLQRLLEDISTQNIKDDWSNKIFYDPKKRNEKCQNPMNYDNKHYRHYLNTNISH